MKGYGGVAVTVLSINTVYTNRNTANNIWNSLLAAQQPHPPLSHFKIEKRNKRMYKFWNWAEKCAPLCSLTAHAMHFTK